MTPTYMPFTYISPAVAETLAALTGPVTVYQPLESPVHDSLATLSDQGKIQLRTPVLQDTDTLRETLSELLRWGRLNPGKSAAGAEFVAVQKETVPFFDGTAVSQIRADIKNYGTPAADPQSSDPLFSARLFLAVAQENDQTVDTLNTDLDQFKALEQGLLDVLEDADTDDFDRSGVQAGTWPEDAGARHTLQRIRAWASVAVEDPDLSNLWITTSPAVMDTLAEYYKDAMNLTILSPIHLKMPDKHTPPFLLPILEKQAAQADLLFSVPDALVCPDDATGPAHLSITLMIAVHHDPRSVIRALTPSGGVSDSPENPDDKPVGSTLILLVQNRPGK